MHDKKMKRKILIIIVLYHCKLNESKSFLSLSPPLKNLIVFDNSEIPQDITAYAGDATYIHNETNIGLSACYNRAAIYAAKYGYDWLLFLDQDTDFSSVSIFDYEKAIDENPICKMVAPMVKTGIYTMSPMNIRFNFSRLSKGQYGGLIDIKNMGVINSGMCVSVEAFEKCGGYNEAVFLDYSDHEFLRRFRKLYKEVYILSKNIYQDFSVSTDSKDKSLKRFGLFCQSIRGCEKYTFKDKWTFAFVVFKRACSLGLKYKTIKPFLIANKVYLNYD